MATDVLSRFPMNRRLFASTFLCGCLCTLNWANAEEESYCIAFERNGGGGFPGFVPLKFTEDFENALVVVLYQLSEVLGVKVGFGYYDDDVKNPNAAAVSAVLTKAVSGEIASDGTVGVGRQLLQITRKRPYFGAAITAICAHEYGHIVQYKHLEKEMMQIDDPTIIKELLADFICGYFAYFRKQRQPEYPAVMQAATQFRLGDGQYNAVSHGTFEQRGCCVSSGFALGERGPSQPKEVALRGLDYVIKLDLKSNACPAS